MAISGSGGKPVPAPGRRSVFLHNLLIKNVFIKTQDVNLELHLKKVLAEINSDQ